MDDPALKGDLALGFQRVAALALDGSATGDAAGFGGFPYVAGDNVACLEATAAVGRAVALAFGRIEPQPRRLARSSFEYILRMQLPSGAWATIPVLGEHSAMTSATADGLSAPVWLAIALGEESRAAPAARRASVSLAREYDFDGGVFNLNPRRTTGADRSCAGLDEAAALALLDARALLQRCGEGESPLARDVLRAFASGLRPAKVGLDTVDQAPMEDYRVGRMLPEKYRTSATEFAWIPFSWRLVLAQRIAEGEADLPRRSDWAKEARRLRLLIPKLGATFQGVPTNWKLAEALMGPAALRAGKKGGGAPGPYRLVRRMAVD